MCMQLSTLGFWKAYEENQNSRQTISTKIQNTKM